MQDSIYKVAACAVTLGVLGCSNMPSEMLDAEAVATLDEALTAALEATDIPGVVALVTTRDSVIYRAAVGDIDPLSQEPMAEDAIFRIHSMTKPITSLGLMILVERGAVGLDDPASDYLPDLRGREVLVEVDTIGKEAVTRPPSGEITVRDLLRHTSGFGYSFSSHELLKLSRHGGLGGRAQPVLHDPGERWTYGMGTAFVGWIIEEVSGQALAEFLEDEVFSPLGMTQTSFSLAGPQISRLVPLARRGGGDLSVVANPDSIVSGGRGDGGLLSTADDYARFEQLILSQGTRDGVRLVGPESIAEMVRNQLEEISVVEQPGANPALSNAFPAGAGRDGFGLGFQISVDDADDRRAPGSLSWAGLANTHFWIDLDTGIGVVLLFQVFPFYDDAVIEIMDGFERALYGRALKQD